MKKYTNRNTKGLATEGDKVIGQTIKRIRIMNDISQEEIAGFLDMSYQQIQKYENGINRVSATNLLKISEYLDVDIRILYGDLISSEGQELVPIFSPKVLRVAKLLNEINDPQILKTVQTLLQNIKK